MTMATAMAVAFVVVSCSGKLKQAQELDLEHTPVQVVNDMFAVQSKDGMVLQRMEASVMERYSTDSLDYDYFPKGIQVYAYTEEGLLETIIVADLAKHRNSGKKAPSEQWEAYGNVVISNVIKRQTMETDTIYWDREKQEIYTHCYVKLSSDQGFMQGYGMRSDDRARNAILLSTFDSYALTSQDSTATAIDSVNFIGPLLK